MKCPTCGTHETEVLYTREVKDGVVVSRRRQCKAGHRFRTWESAMPGGRR
jgi:transcriptional repressor NrdR